MPYRFIVKHYSEILILSTFAYVMKHLFLATLIVLGAVTAPAEAQKAHMSSPDGGMDAYRKVRKEAYDTAKVAVYYDLKFLKDSTKTGDYTKAKTILQLSDKYSKFGDYYQLVLDSLDIFFNESKKNKRNRQARDMWNGAIDRINYYTVSITDLSTYKTKVQTYDGIYDFEYTFEPRIDWTMAPGDTVISGVRCKKATCRYAGRDYIAWYADSIPLPYGPYIFNGLPGLVIDIRDVKNNWIFTYAGMEKARSFLDMYLFKKVFWQDLRAVSREQALAAIRNDIENYDNISIERYKVKTKVNGKWVTPEANYPRRPSNMLELEW